MTTLQLSLAVIAALCGLFVAYPFLVFPAVLRWRRRALQAALARTGWGSSLQPKPLSSVAILFCAYNEAGVLREKIDNLLACAAASPVPVRLYVYLDGCSDASPEIAASYGDLLTVVAPRSRRGKSVGMRTLVRRTSEDLLIFTDANVLFDAELIPRMLQRFERQPAAGCILGSVCFTNSRESQTAQVEGAYWRFEESLKRLETEVGSCLCGTGAIFGIRRETYVPTPDDIIDDLHTTLNVMLSGYAVVQAPEIRVYERAATKPRDEWRRKVRIACRSYNCYRLLRRRLAHLPGPLRFMFVSHKLVRWYAGGPLLLGGASVIALAFTFSAAAGLAVVGLGLLGAWLAAHRVWPLGSVGAVCQALIASTYGVYLSFRGQRFVTWTPVESTR